MLSYIKTMCCKKSKFSELLLYFFFEEDQPSANSHCQSSFLLRKIGPELTSVPSFLHFLYVGHQPQHGLISSA